MNTKRFLTLQTKEGPLLKFDRLAGTFVERSTLRSDPDGSIVGDLQQAHGSFHLTAPVDVVVGASGTFVPMGGANALISPHAHRFTASPDGKLTYTGLPPVHAHVAVSVSFTSSVSSQVVELRVSKNGVGLEPSTVSRKVGTGADVGSTAVHADTMMVTGDYLELQATYTTTNGTVTMEQVYFFALGMPEFGASI